MKAIFMLLLIILVIGLICEFLYQSVGGFWLVLIVVGVVGYVAYSWSNPSSNKDAEELEEAKQQWGELKEEWGVTPKKKKRAMGVWLLAFVLVIVMLQMPFCQRMMDDYGRRHFPQKKEIFHRGMGE